MPVVSNKCIEDIKNERKKCTFNIQELTNYLDGGAEKTKERKHLGNLFYMFNFGNLFYMFNFISFLNNCKFNKCTVYRTNVFLKYLYILI